MAEEKLKADTVLSSLRGTAREKIKKLISDEATKAPERSGLKSDLSVIKDYFESTPETRSISVGASDLAKMVLEEDPGTVNVVYVPEPVDARLIVSQFVRRLLCLKKTAGKAKEKILIVLDEAQEYIPDRTRSDDHTDISNIAVEALLRQGRKYRAHCWLGSQRVAHLKAAAWLPVGNRRT